MSSTSSGQRRRPNERRVLHSMDAVLVVWAPASDAPEESLWTRLTAALAESVRAAFPDPAEARNTPSTSILDQAVEEVLEQRDDEGAEVEYCTNEWTSIETAIRRAIAGGARQVVIVPMIFALDEPHPAGHPITDLTAHISKLETRYPEIEMVYVGPPFAPRKQLRLIFSKIRGDEPEKADLLEEVIGRGFGGDWALFTRFMQKLERELLPDTRVAIRGSVVTGHSWGNGTPFDALGPGTSDLDMVLIGEQAMLEWHPDAFYIPEVNTMPLSDKTPDAAPRLNPIRVQLQQMVGRPVSIQAMTEWYLDLRRYLLGQPYLLLD